MDNFKGEGRMEPKNVVNHRYRVLIFHTQIVGMFMDYNCTKYFHA